jgi:undecaprenyl diphosphate synthase
MTTIRSIDHLAIIMDGNGRWATRKNLPRHVGHAAGADAAMELVEACLERNISTLTLYALSVENMSRDEKEVDFIKNLFTKKMIEKKDSLIKNKVRVRVVGERSLMGEHVRSTIDEIERSTASNTRLQLNIAFNYSGRWHIEEALRATILESHSSVQSATAAFRHHMTAEITSEPDLLIRTGGETRLSNFMLWHLAYTELLFMEIHWPDFKTEQLDEALKVYKMRDRRFGQVEKTELI